MKKFFLPIFAVLLVLGSILPLAAYRVTRAVLSAFRLCPFPLSGAKEASFKLHHHVSADGEFHSRTLWVDADNRG